MLLGFIFSPRRTTKDTPAFLRRKTLRIRCPACDWQPAREDRWCCAPDGCGHVWNTFETHGVCPECTRQWTRTMCLRCDAWPLHEEWYEEEDVETP